MSGIALLASRLKSSRASSTPRHTESFMTYTSRNELDEADLLDEVFANPRVALTPEVILKKEPRDIKSLDLSKIAAFAEKTRARRMLNDILEQWSSFSALSKNTRESSVMALFKTMSGARRRLLASSLLNIQVFTSRLSGSTPQALIYRPDELTMQKTHLVTIPPKPTNLTCALIRTVEVNGGDYLKLTLGVEKAASEILRIEQLLAN